MGGKKIEALNVEVDELALSLVGWQVEEVQARLVTESFGKKDHYQEVSVSGTMRFLAEDWSERFSDDDHDDYVPTPHLIFNRRDAVVPPSFDWLLLETMKKARKRPLRMSRKSRTWSCESPLRPADLSLTITAYDLDDLSTEFQLAPAATQEITLDIFDETSQGSIRTRMTKSSACILGHDDGEVRIHLEGVFEYGSAEELLADYLAAEDWRDRDAPLGDTVPFEVDVPGFVVEVMDATGFLLDNRTLQPHGHIPVGEAGKLPGRPPRWAVQANIDLDDMAGVPSRVVVRIQDAEDL